MDNKIYMQQVHGNNVAIVDKQYLGKVIPRCDALVTNDPEVTLCVRTADCLPISIRDIDNTFVALVHAGWRGLDNKIIEQTIETVTRKFNVNPKDISVLIGPHICSKHYEVKDDVALKFSEVVSFNGKKYLNLRNAAINQLVGLGVKIENIKVDNRCTFEDASLPSYRRNKTDKRIETILGLNI